MIFKNGGAGVQVTDGIQMAKRQRKEDNLVSAKMKKTSGLEES